MLTDKQAEELAVVLKCLSIAEGMTQEATKKLAAFGVNVPSLSSKGIEMFCKSINEIDKNMAFVRSFIRVSTLQQFAKVKETTT